MDGGGGGEGLGGSELLGGVVVAAPWASLLEAAPDGVPLWGGLVAANDWEGPRWGDPFCPAGEEEDDPNITTS